MPPTFLPEDPCGITNPRLFVTIDTSISGSPETPVTLNLSPLPLRNSDMYGGFAEPRVLELSPITRVASDPSTGAWSANTMTLRLADTDRVLRSITESRRGFRRANVTAYLASKGQLVAEGTPWILLAGQVYHDSQDQHLVTTMTINDLIGVDYSLFNEEKQIPQRVIGISHFPNAAAEVLGRGEPILGGDLSPRDPLKGQGIVDCITVGNINVGGTRGIPGAPDIAALVADLQASADAGTLDHDFGDRLGHADCVAYEHGTIPSDEAGLKAAFGSGDIDAILSDYTISGGDTYLAVMIASHAIKAILDTTTGPSIWIGDTQLDPSEIGVSVWCPQITGDTSWASDISTDLFTDLTGSNGETRRYTLILIDPASDIGTQVAGGAQVRVDCIGMEDEGDGTGDAITDIHLLYKHVLINFILQTYLSGAWLSSPQFLYADRFTLIDRVQTGSFGLASTTAQDQLVGGWLGSFKIGGERTSVRTIISNFNMSAGCFLGVNDTGQIFIKVIPRNRSDFLSDGGSPHRTLRDTVDILPGFSIEAKPDWQVNKLNFLYAMNYAQNQYEHGSGGGGVAPLESLSGQERDGVLEKTIELPYVRDDATALVIAQNYLDLFTNLPRVVTYTRRGLCGLEDDVLDGVPITHYNGYGENGWQDHAILILSKTFDPKGLVCSFTGLDVDGADILTVS